MHFDRLQYMNIISELFRLVKIKQFHLNCTALMIPSSFSIILTKR